MPELLSKMKAPAFCFIYTTMRPGAHKNKAPAHSACFLHKFNNADPHCRIFTFLKQTG